MGSRLKNQSLSDNLEPRLAADLQVMRRAVRQGGLLALDYYFERKQNSHRLKQDGSQVSDADLAVDSLLHQKLLDGRKDYGWLSEETTDDLTRLERDRVFIVDPIDGTRAFLKNKPHWVVSAALVVRGEVLAGCLFNPVNDEFFEAVKGRGARLNGATIRVGGRDEIEGGTIIAAPGRFNSRMWKRKWPVVSSFIVNSVAYRIALVASGKADALLSLSGKSDWDLAAAALILSEAGGVMTDHKGGELFYNRENTRHMSVLAANPRLHALMLERTCEVEASKRHGCDHDEG